MNKYKKESEEFAESLQDDMRDEYNALQPVILEIVKKGMQEGERRKEHGEGIDKIQLDAAKIASSITQYYIEQLVGKPLSRAEISGKNGKPLNMNLSFVLSKESNPDESPIETSDDDDDDDEDDDKEEDLNNGEETDVRHTE